MGKSSPRHYSTLTSGGASGTGASVTGWILSCCCRHHRCGTKASCCISGAVLALTFCVMLYYVGWTSFQQQQVEVGNPLPEAQSAAVPLPAEQRALGKSMEVSTRYVVTTSSCKIPEMNPWDKSIQNFLRPDFGYPVDCQGKHKRWIELSGNRLSVNLTALHESGYSISAIRCCYRIIERVEQPWSDFDMNADNYVKYSDKCHPIHEDGVNIDAEFLRVHCISKLPPLYNDVVYRDFFAIAQPSSDRLVAQKLYKWKIKSNKSNVTSKSTTPPPPNVVIIGVDNNSRMNSHRHLKETIKILQSMGAIEMRGYTKVGENTFPNTVPFLSGYGEKDLASLCYQSNAVPQDNCPYIWKAFDKVADYLTIHAEDSPYLGGFNYLKTGFVRKPTDFYLRPLMLAVMTYMKRFVMKDYYHTDFIGRYMTDKFTFNYILDVLRLSSAHGAPAFVHSWLTSLAHHSYNNLQYGDNSIAHFIQSLVNITQDNTIFFFMSDHGQRYGPIRETTQGWYEDKLPTQWVYIPKRIQKQFPEWHANLVVNSGRLTSHFDVYKTMLHILKSFSSNSSSSNPYADQVFTAAESQYGLSFFQPIPENRTCAEAGITVNFCACSKPTPMDVQNAVVLKAAEASVRHLKNLLPLDVCAEPTLKKIVTAGFLDLPGKPVYVLTFYTDPGDFLFEVNVEKRKEDGDNEFVITTDFLRMNKITRAADCVSTPLLERYCYCK